MADVRVDGLAAAELAVRLDVPQCVLYDRVASTMDLAHAAAGRDAPAGTIILAHAQDAGRGRGGRRWTSPHGTGLWMTLIERPASPAGLDALSLRLGLRLAESLDDLAGERVRLKWPNDLQLAAGKLGGILVEARWRDQRVEWVAIGLGLNVSAPPDVPGAAGLLPGATRTQVLDAILRPMRAAAALDRPLSPDELRRFSTRDTTLGRLVSQPAAGVVAGVGSMGELLVDTTAGRVACRTGSLVFAEDR